jgi:tetratricopeptide (TPR) repeat protein
MTSSTHPIIARLSFTSLLIGACCLVLLSVCFVEAQEDLAHFDVNSALGEGYRLLNEGRFDRAEVVFEDVIAHDPTNRKAIEGLVWVAFSSGRYAEAGRAADKVRILDPQDIGWTRQWINVIWHDPDRRGEALAEARSLLTNDENDIDTRLLLASLLSRESQTWAKAITEYDNVLERAPQNVNALIGRARLATWTGDLDKAYRFLQMALAVDRSNTIVTEQIESIKDAAKELSHSRMQLFGPLALTIIFLSVSIGYSMRELSCKLYLLLFLQVVVLMSLAALWVYVPPTAIVSNSN